MPGDFTSGGRELLLNFASPASLSKHLPSADTMALNVDVDELENSHGATYVRKKAAKVTGENQTPKEQGYVQTSSSFSKKSLTKWQIEIILQKHEWVCDFFFANSQGDIKKKRKKKKGITTKNIYLNPSYHYYFSYYFLHVFKLQSASQYKLHKSFPINFFPCIRKAT